MIANQKLVWNKERSYDTISNLESAGAVGSKSKANDNNMLSRKQQTDSHQKCIH